MSPVVRRAFVLLTVLVAGACSGAATEPHPNRRPLTVPHFDGTDTTNRSGYTAPHS
jgi:hypothetical protein